MSKAYYSNGSSYSQCTPDMVQALGAKYANGYYGMTYPTLADSDWVRTTNAGLIPYKSGGASSLGTSSWPFSNVYANNFYGNSFSGNASTATALTTSAGSSTQPVYFSGGKPVACTAHSSASVNYANSAGSASTASKLATARTITLSGMSEGSASFDGSGNITISDTGLTKAKYVTTDDTSKPYYRLATTSGSNSWYDASFIGCIDSGHVGYSFGIFKCCFRIDNNATAGDGRAHAEVEWLVRSGFEANQLIVCTNSPSTANATHYADLYFKANTDYDTCNMRILIVGGRGAIGRTWFLTDSNEPTLASPSARTYTASSYGVDVGIASQAANEYAVAVSSSTPTDSRTKIWITP